MKFKAVIAGDLGGQIPKQVFNVLQALHRLERALERSAAERRGAPPASVVLKLSAEALAICHNGGVDEGMQTWSHFEPKKLFCEYRCESKRQNKIDLEAPIANLVRVFHSCATSDRTVLKLANGRDGRPILGFEFTLAGNAADHRVDQEVPVRVVPEAEAEAMKEPVLPEPEYQMELPPSLGRLKNVLDKMRQVGAHHVFLEAAQETASGGAFSGRAWLRLAAEAELVTVVSKFPSLVLVMEGKKVPSPEGPVGLLLSLRRLAEVLAAFQQVGAEAHIACVLEGRALVLYAVLPGGMGSLISYTPAVVV